MSNMDTKAIIMERLGAKKLSKKSRLVGYDADGTKVHDNLGEEVALEVLRYNGEKDYVLGRYDHDARLYRVAYDPNIAAGPIKSIENAYSAV